MNTSPERQELLRDNVERIYPERIEFFERWARIWGCITLVNGILFAGVVASTIAGWDWVASLLAALAAAIVVVGWAVYLRGQRGLPEPHHVD